MKDRTKTTLGWVAVTAAYVISFIMLIAVIVCIMYSCNEVDKKISERGFKNMVEEVWEGKQSSENNL